VVLIGADCPELTAADLARADRLLQGAAHVVLAPAADGARRALVAPATALWNVGGIGVLVLGIWLALDVDAYEVWDGWILAAIVLWLVAVATGSIASRSFATATERAAATAASLRSRGLALHTTSSLAYLAILVLMIFKPGA
jgi:hypothetical protein